MKVPSAQPYSHAPPWPRHYPDAGPTENKLSSLKISLPYSHFFVCFVLNLFIFVQVPFYFLFLSNQMWELHSMTSDFLPEAMSWASMSPFRPHHRPLELKQKLTPEQWGQATPTQLKIHI